MKFNGMKALFFCVMMILMANDYCVANEYQIIENKLEQLQLKSSVSAMTSKEQQQIDREAAQLIQQWVEEVSPFVHLLQDDQIFLDEESARLAGVSKEALSLVKVFQSVGKEAFSKRKLPDDLSYALHILSPFFQKIAAGELKMKSEQAMEAFSWPTYCGGGYDSPHSCPNRVRSVVRWKKKSEVEILLKAYGYHKTSRVGCFGAPDDFTKCVDAYGCGGKLFRLHGRIEKVDSKYTYSTQGPEPNPEIDTYSAPTWWWDAYCAWWHLSYC